MSTIYEIMQHNYTHRIKESGVHTSLHPVCPCPNEVPSAYALQYHSTDVVTAYPNGSVKLDSGGWITSTTKERINRYLPIGQLYQKKFGWFIAMPDGEQVEFRDGMTITPRGMCVYSGKGAVA